MLKKIDSKFRIIGDIPIQDPAETSQFERALALLREAAGRIGPWCIVVLDVLYYHNRGKVIDGDNDWNSQIDILVFSENKIIVYELKGFTAKIIYGKTDNQDWIIKRRNSTQTNKVSSFFKQASKHHAFLVRDFLPEYRDNHPQLSENHWIVDARVVLKPESDLSGFFYKIPQTFFRDKFKSDVIDMISGIADIELIQKLYSGIEEETGKLSAVTVTPEEYKRAINIFRDNGITPRTTKWFRPITEKQIQSDISVTGSDKFRLDWDSAMDIGMQLKNGA